MNAEEIVYVLHRICPSARLAVYGDAKSAVAYMNEKTKRWIAYYAATIVCGVLAKVCGQAIRVNGKPLYAETEWKEVLFDKESGDTYGH